MCGFLGFINRQKNISELKFLKALDTLHNRGPDNTNYYISDNCYLGHKRLSILDLSENGSQPMISTNGRFIIVYNGEIYNFRELKKELSKDNILWVTNTDTEVVLYSYIKWGEKCLKKFEGMFSFAIYDKKNKSIFAARDRMGVKPFFYSYNYNNLTFSSRPQAILKLNPNLSKIYNADAINIYLSAGYVPAPLSIYKDLNQLPPGSYLVWKNNKLEIKKWWNPNNILVDTNKTIKSLGTYEEELESIFIESIEKRLISDVPVGVFLSGGIDSSLITALVSKIKKDNLKSFSIGFNEKKYDESRYFKKVAHFLGIENRSKSLSSQDLLDLMPRFEKNFDEPFSDSACFPTMAISKLAKKSVKVVLSGDGGDELFGGYHYYKIIKNIDIIMNLPNHLKNLIISGIELFPGHQFKLLSNALKQKNSIHAFGFMRSVSKDFYKLLNKTENQDLFKNLFFKSYLEMPKNQKLEEYVTRLDLKHTLGDGYLQKLDLSTMAFSLEAREPFLDTQIVDFALKLPWKYKYNRGITKYLIKRICKKYLPNEIINRNKKGFEVPISEWLRGPLKKWCIERIEEKSLYENLPINIENVRTLYDIHLKSNRNVTPFLWNILVLLNFSNLKKANL